jgi:UDPglucose 6-dehydrogenase
MPNIKKEVGDAIELVDSAYAAVEQADALVLVTEWHEFRHPDLGRLSASMKGKVLFDGRNVWAADEARQAGFTYSGIGRRL